jgi:predicted permease
MKLMLPLTFLVLILKDLYLKQLSVAVITVAVMLSILWLIFIPKRLKKNAEKRFLKVLNSGDNSSILGLHKIKMSDEGINVEKPNSSGFMNWSAFTKIEQTVDHYFLYNSAISALIIPKMKLGTMSQYVHDELKKHFPDLQNLPKA